MFTGQAEATGTEGSAVLHCAPNFLVGFVSGISSWLWDRAPGCLMVGASGDVSEWLSGDLVPSRSSTQFKILLFRCVCGGGSFFIQEAHPQVMCDLQCRPPPSQQMACTVNSGMQRKCF